MASSADSSRRGSPVEEIMTMREDLITFDRIALRNLWYLFLWHEGDSCDSNRPEMPVASNDAMHLMFTVKTMYFTAKMCLTCVVALFQVRSQL